MIERFVAVRRDPITWMVYDTKRAVFILTGLGGSEEGEAACRAAAGMMNYDGFTVPIPNYDYALDPEGESDA